MHEAIYARIDDVPDTLWDSIAPADFFFQRAFLRVMEESGVEDATYRYVMLLASDAPVGLAVLSGFTLKLDLLSGDPWIRRMRRWLPGLLDVPMICCGIPASFGQHHLHVIRPELRRAAVHRVHRCMDAWADETRCGMLLWKEWSAAQGVRELVRAEGYVALPTLPDHTVPRLPGTIEEFVGMMRSPYRRKYRAAAALMRGPRPVSTAGSLRLEESPFTADAADEFFRGYRKVMERTRVRLETYPEAFFRGLARSSLDVRTLRLVNGATGQSLTALLIPSGDVLSFALVAKDRAHYDDALYTVLLQCIVLYGVRGRFTAVRLGQTSGYAKCSVGAQPQRLETFIRMRGPARIGRSRVLVDSSSRRWRRPACRCSGVGERGLV